MDIIENPIITRFQIIGLHGYKDVTIDFDSKVRILIAENGFGKTTILYALYSILECKFENLKSIDFEEIRCSFKKDNEIVVINKKNISDSFNLVYSDAIEEIIINSDLDEQTISTFIHNEFDPNDISITQNSYIGRRLFETSPWQWDHIHDILLSVFESNKLNQNSETRNIINKIKELMGDTEVLYLPTYRRVEKLINEDRIKSDLRYNSLTQISRKRLNSSLSNSSQLNYGLADVEDRLATLTEDVQKKTNIGYREISASIIDDLLSGRTESKLPENAQLPSLETLKLFFSRVRKSSSSKNDYLDEIDKIYEEYSTGNNKNSTLIYFLSKLSHVVNQTKQLESIIENFVVKANTYLGTTSDSKSFNYDPESMKVSVINKWTEKEVKLNDLSSGEKQIVSLLSYLFLYPSNKIVLMDEPELSLSIDWQQKILVDIAEAPTCKQLLAITHSPFTFDNKLDPYATSVSIIRKSKKEDI